MLKRVNKFAEEFKTFALRGNVIDMAVGIIIGAAFGKLVDSLVKDVIMPPLGWVLGKVDFSQLFVVLPTADGINTYPTYEAAQAAGAVTINYGVFINTIISFVLVAFAVFMLIKMINRLNAKKVADEKEAEPTTKECPYCYSTVDIRARKCPHCVSELG